MVRLFDNQEKAEIIIQIGQDRVRNICSICHKKMDIKNYHIQLCKSCRRTQLNIELDKVLKKVTKQEDQDGNTTNDGIPPKPKDLGILPTII